MTGVTPIKDLRGYLQPEEIERLTEVASNPRDRLLIRIPWRTGIRVSELIGIRIQDIDFDNRAIVIKVLKQRKRDGKAIERRRVIPIDQGSLDMVRKYLEWRKRFPYKGDLLFPIYQAEGRPDLLEAGEKSRDKGDRRPCCLPT